MTGAVQPLQALLNTYEDVTLDPEKIMFIPLQNKTNKSLLGLKLLLENYQEKDHNSFLNGAYQMIDTILGEKTSA